MTSYDQGLGERIKMIRMEKGMTLEEFGKHILNANKSVVSKWENNLTVPSNERLLKIAEMGQVTVEYLMTGKTDTALLSKKKGMLFKNQNDSLVLNEWKRLYYPDIKEILEQEKVYYDRKHLDKEDKAVAINVLDYLFKDLAYNYPSDEKIKNEYNKINKTLDIENKKESNNNHKVKE